MPIDPDAVGVTYGPNEGAWSSKDALLYALGVGCGAHELAFTTENTAGVPQQVLPTFACVAAMAEERLSSTTGTGNWLESVGPFDLAMLVHGGQEVELHRPLPAACEFVERGTVTGIYDKKTAAVIATETVAAEKSSGDPLYTLRSRVFIRGEGGWGGDRGPSVEPPHLDRAPDHRASFTTHPDQALLYRLSGDRNPLHSDPSFAARAGFSQPILHGLCTFGITGRALLESVCGGDTSRFLSMDARFSKPVLPGDVLDVSIWLDSERAWFRTQRGDDVVLDHGSLRFR